MDQGSCAHLDVCLCLHAYDHALMNLFFFQMNHDERLASVQNVTGISDDQVSQLKDMEGISFELADRLVENVISTISIPIGVATNMIVDGTGCFIGKLNIL